MEIQPFNRVAITGSLACGKSSVCQLLKELGAYVVSADEIVHQLLSSDINLGQKVVALLGKKILINKKIDRSLIAEIVFQDEQLLSALETILHPAVYNELERDYREQQQKAHPPSLYVAEIPLLFETGMEKNFNATIAVLARPTLCFQRFKLKTNRGKEEFESRVARQLPLEEKARLATYAVLNNGSLADLEVTVKELYQELCCL